MKKICTFTLCLFAFALAGCNAPSFTTKTFSEMYLGAPVSVVMDTHDKSRAEYNKLFDGIQAIFQELDDLLDPQDSDSDVYKFNALKAGESITIDAATAEIVSAALKIGKISGGAYDIAAYPLVDLWGFSPDKYGNENYEFAPPSDDDIAEILPLCSSDNLLLEGNTLKKLNYDGVKIDLGGIAKGYAVQKAAEYLRENGVENGYISAGTSSIALLKYKEKEKWSFSVNHPRKNGLLFTMPTSDIYVSTSGDYERQYIYNGVTYCHILDPNTGKPIANGVMSVTILGNNSSYCDALSTALCVLGAENAKTFTEKYLQDYRVFIAYEKDGKNYLYSNVAKENFTINDESYFYVN